MHFRGQTENNFRRSEALYVALLILILNHVSRFVYRTKISSGTTTVMKVYNWSSTNGLMGFMVRRLSIRKKEEGVQIC